MRAIKAHYDGKNVVVPPEAVGLPAGEVLLIFSGADAGVDSGWLGAQERALAQVWDNDEDAAYDKL